MNGAASFKVSDTTEMGVFLDNQTDYFQRSDTLGLSFKEKSGDHISQFRMGYTTVEDGRGIYENKSKLLKFNAYQMRNDGRWRINVDGIFEPSTKEYRVMSGISLRFGRKKQ